MYHQTASLDIRVGTRAVIRVGGERGCRRRPLGAAYQRVPRLAVFLGAPPMKKECQRARRAQR